MKKNNEFIIRELEGKYLLIPFGQKALDFNGVITVNETAKFLWETCGEEINQSDLVNALVTEYDVDCETAEKDAADFIKVMKEAGCIND